ncbi:MAG TPA: ROK family protein [Candidatus Acidoferrum sp.]|nr:ROK family protein [Candidatus Acidoferrum sp.]
MSKHSTKSPAYIGVDLGGTNVRAGLVQNGRIVSLHKQAISSHAEQKIVLEEIYQTIAAVLQPNVTAIGIGVPSLVKDGVVYSAANIPSWRKVPLKRLLEKRFNIPAHVNNDAKCFALGELYYGWGRGRRNLVGLIIGTGLGCGVIINGRIYRGANGGAGEIGHAPYKAEEFEYYCSGRFFKREFGLDSAEIQNRADAGDFKAAEMLAAFGDHFADFIIAVLYAYDPEMIVLGGGVSRAYHYFEPRMREKLRIFKFQDAVKRLKIVVTKKPHIAVLAAAALCLDKP